MLPGGALYITAANLEHTGNYTCFDLLQPTVKESQVLVVQGEWECYFITASKFKPIYDLITCDKSEQYVDIV